MDSRLALDVFAGILVIAGPVLFIVFCTTFKEDPSDHPIYRHSDRSAHEAAFRSEMQRNTRLDS